MIGKLKGTIDEIGEDYVLVDVHGVCYVAYCSARTLSKLGSAGEACVLFIETYVREDQLRLFGFMTALEREWFHLLQSVQGVGAKVALAVLSTLTPGELANAIALQDRAAVSRAPGVGPKWRCASSPNSRTGRRPLPGKRSISPSSRNSAKASRPHLSPMRFPR